nr:YidB family protein [Mesorhizobium shangrilense]
MASRNMTALLAMLAVAGWQNRDRLGELLGSITGQSAGGQAGGTRPGAGVASAGAGGLGGLLGELFGGSPGAKQTDVSGGLGELIDNFSGSGHGDVADSWVQPGPNKDVEEPQLAEALGSDTIDQLASQTGLSREELLARLKSVLPEAVDKMTPNGRLPTREETSPW